MQKGDNSIKKKIIIILSVIIGCLVILILLLSLRQCNCTGDSLQTDQIVEDTQAVEWNGNQHLPQPAIGDSPAIAINGFKELTFTANQLNQSVNFNNPANNKCYFKMHLYVEGQKLWQSEYVAPGDGYYTIKLDKPLSVGKYEAYLLIKCFKSDKTEINSAKVNFNLNVI